MTIYAKHLKTFSQKSEGLLRHKKVEPVYFETRWGIHTFLMKYPIDVVVMDKKNTVVKLKKDLKPNRIFVWNPAFEKILELPSGSIQKWQLKKGVELRLHLT